MSNALQDNYQNPIGLTSQFRFCGNAFRLDFYRFCTFGCSYCFARTLNNDGFKSSYAKFEIIEKLFQRAFETTEETNNLTIELLRHKVPLHIGGMSDPFQPIEFQYKLNYKLIELSNKYNYPLIFSTKQCYLPEEYWGILNPKLHAFQISLIGLSEDYVRKYEHNSPSPQKRLEFLKELRRKGFWCSIRIQPIIDMKEVLALCKEIDGIASYITAEHLKINIENPKYKEIFKDILPQYTSRNAKTRDMELDIEQKRKNIEQIKSVLKTTKLGVGDNDLHYLSESRCCCGIDTINENFNNYLKYNLTYFTTEHLGNTKASEEDYWLPQGNISSVLNSTVKISNINTLKEYVEVYCSKHEDFMCEGCSMKDKFRGVFYDKKTGDKYKQIDIFDLGGNND